MRVLYILCGGKGKRLGAITRNVPKPLIKINGKPFIIHLINIYSKYFNKIVLLAGYMGEKFLPLKSNEVEVIIESKPLGTGGTLISMKNELPEQFFLCNGDTFLEPLDIREFILTTEARKQSTLLLSEEERKARGALKVKNGKIVEFIEKAAEGIGKVYTGMCFIRKTDLPDPVESGEISLEKEIFPEFAKKGRLMAHECNCSIYDIGSVKGIKKFKELIIKNS